ncbi:MAG TPA: hypothetical protein VLT86_03710 [Vicinamibacterales bacterium]|nr:hypothetical protein [Vicinamibacterales bacterium]
MTRQLLVSTLVAALASGACFNPLSQLDQTTATQPSATGVQALSGTWASVSSTTTLTNTCTNFRWMVTDINGSTGSGTFTATCFQNMSVSGTATGTMTGSTITWTATAIGRSPTSADCPISLAGTATLDNGQIRVPYTGTTCLGPVSGTEILRQ